MREERCVCCGDMIPEGIQVCPSHIKDSGNRRQFESGAVRDIQEGKGRCDLLPLDVVAQVIDSPELLQIYQFTEDGVPDHLMLAIETFTSELFTAILDVSKHFEEGAKKYGDNNWRKGIPAHCYIDSAVRHYLKWCRKDTDEPHDRAFLWNLMCCIWTVRHKPELNEFRKVKIMKDVKKVPMLTDDRFDKIEQFAELVKPLQQWMLKNYCPHTKIIIECDGATVTTDDMFVPLNPLKDGDRCVVYSLLHRGCGVRCCNDGTVSCFKGW